jgi:hypothetical protein
MFKWLFGEKKTQVLIEDHIEKTASEPETVSSREDKYQTHLTYFTVPGGDGNIFLSAVMEATPTSVSEMANIIANMFSVKIQASTINVIRENLLKSERTDLVQHFEKELVTATMKKPVLNTKAGEEEPCVSPSDLMT